MAGIYLHIPFCKQACHYCDFHFSTQLGKKRAMLEALQRELSLRRDELGGEAVETIYFGGGTPSLLEVEEIGALLAAVQGNFPLIDLPEITLEANPDDLSPQVIRALSKTPINRLSIGIQSFFDQDLILMNRAHKGREAIQSLEGATAHFENLSIDLIYGIPGLDNGRWRANIEKALGFGLPHISSYALTVERGTALHHFIQKGKVPALDEEQAREQFQILTEILESEGYVHYEISNFGKEGYFSRNNTSYWLGKKYLGIGPSAHSFDGLHRSWNISNNPQYIKEIQQGILPREVETLSVRDRYNEYVMTGLRTLWGVSLERVHTEFGPGYGEYLLQQAQKYLDQGLLAREGERLVTTGKGKFLADGIASDLFFVIL